MCKYLDLKPNFSWKGNALAVDVALLFLGLIWLDERMWRLKQLIPKEQAGLEGKSVDVGSLKLQIRSTIAQGGFSSVYLARDAKSGKQYAVKHIICNDTESVDLVKKEVATMRALRGHPNVVALHSQSMYDMGRTKECFLVMEYCEKMLVNVLDSKEGEYFDEKQVLLIIRDVCNAVYAMHCQSPPIAHRDLKAENLLLGSDGVWKLCDFGSTSTNHKRFERADEMGIEEDIIRKHTTPAYRAPEMWDLYRRDLISEKVDIWALGCLLYRIAYLKSAFDGESKLQILNGNYRIPDSPKYSANITSLIKDMLNSSPESRPDAMQLWTRVNDALPSDHRKISPDQVSSTLLQSTRPNADPTQPSVMPTRAPPLPPRESQRRSPPPPPHIETDSCFTSKETDHPYFASAEKDSAAMGSFWATQHAQKAHFDSDVIPAKDKFVLADSPPRTATKTTSAQGLQVANSPDREHQSRRTPPKRSGGTTALAKYSETSMHQTGFHTLDEDSFAPKFDDENFDANNAALKESSSIGVPSSGGSHRERVKFSPDEAFSEFVADFQKTAFTVGSKTAGRNEQDLQLEVQSLRTELNQVQAEKSDIASKYDKLTAICRSQRLEIQDLKSALAVATTAAASNNSNSQNPMLQSKSQDTQPPLPRVTRHSSEQNQEGRQVGSIWDLQEGLSLGGSKRVSAFDPQGWKAFDDDGGFQAVSSATTKQSASNAGFQAVPTTNRQSVSGSGLQLVRPTNKQQAGSESYQQDSFGGGGRDTSVNGSGKKRQQGQGHNAHSRAASFQVGDGWGMMQDSFSGGAGGGFETTKGSVPSYNVPTNKQQLPAEATYISGFGSSASGRRSPSTATTTTTTTTTKNGSRAPAHQVQPAGWAGF